MTLIEKLVQLHKLGTSLGAIARDADVNYQRIYLAVKNENTKSLTYDDTRKLETYVSNVHEKIKRWE